jgi:predicted peptidase
MSAPLSAQSIPSAKPGVLTEGSATVKNDSGSTSSMGFWTWLPKAEKPASGWPLMVFLHGAGERGSDLNLVKKHGPPKLAGQEPVMDRFFMLAPQCPTGRWWDVVAVKDLIDQTLASQPVDPKRVYITGISMGGFATWALLKDYPTLMAAAVPICGGGDPASVARFSSVPVWAFHGDKDEAVPAQRSIDMVEALKQAKGDIRFTLYPGVTHDSWTRTFENPELYEWLLKHQQK